MRPYVELLVLRDRMVDACAWYFAVRDDADTPPVVVRTLGEAAVAAIDAYMQELDAFERIRREVHCTYPLDPLYVN
jgi:hypothetical protein